MRLYVPFLLTACYVLSYMDRLALSLLVEQVKEDLLLNDTQIGLLQGMGFTLFYIIAGFPLSRLIDHGNRKKIISVCISVWGTMTALCGLAASFVQLLLARVGVASGEAGLVPGALSIFTDLYHEKKLVKVVSIFMMAPYIGSGLILLLGGALLNYFISLDESLGYLPGGLAPWQMVFICVGLPGLVFSLLVWTTIPEPERKEAGVAKIGPVEERYKISDLVDHFKSSLVFFGGYFVAIACVAVTLNVIMAWTPAALIRAYGVSEYELGIVFGPVYIVSGIAGCLAAGYLTSMTATSNIKDAVMKVMKYLSFVLIIPVCISGLIQNLYFSIAMIGVVIFIASGLFAISIVPLQLMVPNRMRAQFFVVFSTFCSLIGAGGGPFLVGIVSDFIDSTSSLGIALVTVSLASTVVASSILWFLRP